MIEESMPNIFISYRREESAYVAAALAEKLAERYGKHSVFLDVDNIPIGVDFRQHLHGAISHAHLVLVIIGDSWIDCADENKRRRLDHPRDFVRIEIEAALRFGIPIAPILIGKACMPHEEQLPQSIRLFAYRNATELRAGKDFPMQLHRLVDCCSVFEPSGESRYQPSAPKSYLKPNVPSKSIVRIVSHLVSELFMQLFWMRKSRNVVSRLFQMFFFASGFIAFVLSIILALGLPNNSSTTSSEISTSPPAGPWMIFFTIIFPWIPVYLLVYFPGRLLELVTANLQSSRASE
ncbi:MAG: toll/interleukin-1 receptor domain-containing protein [Pirellulales bacterium]